MIRSGSPSPFHSSEDFEQKIQDKKIETMNNKQQQAITNKKPHHGPMGNGLLLYFQKLALICQSVQLPCDPFSLFALHIMKQK